MWSEFVTNQWLWWTQVGPDWGSEKKLNKSARYGYKSSANGFPNWINNIYAETMGDKNPRGDTLDIAFCLS